jgi:hypothetical protein
MEPQTGEPQSAIHRKALLLAVLGVGLVIALPLGLVVACRNSSPENVVADAQLTMPLVRAFDNTYPGAVHWITHYTGQYGHPIWNSEVGLFGRYVLTMQAPVDLNVVRSRVVRFHRPTFVLLEVTDVEFLPDGRAVINYGESKQFGPAEWALLAGDGDLRSIGFEPITDWPVANFERALTNR